MRKISDIEKATQKKSRLAIYFGEHVWNTCVYLDGRPIGLIQEINVAVKADDVYPRVKVVFPKMDERYPSDVVDSITKYIEALATLPYVKVAFRSIEESKDETDQEVTEPVWSSSEEDFQKSLDMVRDGKKSM